MNDRQEHVEELARRLWAVQQRWYGADNRWADDTGEYDWWWRTGAGERRMWIEIAQAAIEAIKAERLRRLNVES